MVLLSNLDWFIAFQINKGHPPQDEDIFLAPQLQGVIKPHQVVISIFYWNVVHWPPDHETNLFIFGSILDDLLLRTKTQFFSWCCRGLRCDASSLIDSNSYPCNWMLTLYHSSHHHGSFFHNGCSKVASFGSLFDLRINPSHGKRVCQTFTIVILLFLALLNLTYPSHFCSYFLASPAWAGVQGGHKVGVC